MATFGLIGGSGLLGSDTSVLRDANLSKHTVTTTAGPVVLHVGRIGDSSVKLVFCQRHAAAPGAEYSQPADINYAAIALGMKALGVQLVVGVYSVGTLHPATYREGDLVVPSDYYCPYDLRPVSSGHDAHFVPGFDGDLRSEVLDVLFTAGLRPKDGGVYVNSKGPRFETKAEIRAFAAVGDLVGMTAAHESSALQEVGLRHAAVCMCDNVCHGLSSVTTSSPDALSLQSFKAAQRGNVGVLERTVSGILDHFGETLAKAFAATTAASSAGAGAGAGAGAATGADAAGDATHVDLVVHARYVVPVAPKADTVLENHAVVVKDGIIVDVLPQADATAKYNPKETVHLLHHVLTPGFINAHTHISMNLLRGLADDVPLKSWLTEHMWPAEGRLVSPEFCRAGARHAMAEMIRCGTTCFNDMYFFPEDVAEEVDAVGMRAALACTVFMFPSAWASSADEYFTKGLAAVDRFADHNRITWTVGPHAPYTVDDATFKRVVEVAKERDLKVHVHLHETADECMHSLHGARDEMMCHLSDKKCRPLENLDELGVVNDRLVAAHCTHLTDAEIARLAAVRASVVHCPNSNLKLGSGFCPVAKLSAAGVNVCLGTDSSASNNSLDVLAEMKLAAVLAKGVSGDTTAVPAHEALCMATINGAKALGIDDKVGSITVGKEADLTAIRLDELELAPVYNVISHVVYVAGRESVTDVWVRGVRLLDCARLTTLDKDKVTAEAHLWGDKVRDPAAVKKAVEEAEKVAAH